MEPPEPWPGSPGSPPEGGTEATGEGAESWERWQRADLPPAEPLGSWWPGAQLTETAQLQPRVPVRPHIPFATTVSLESAAGTVGVGSPHPEPALQYQGPGGSPGMRRLGRVRCLAHLPEGAPGL